MGCETGDARVFDLRAFGQHLTVDAHCICQDALQFCCKEKTHGAQKLIKGNQAQNKCVAALYPRKREKNGKKEEKIQRRKN